VRKKKPSAQTMTQTKYMHKKQDLSKVSINIRKLIDNEEATEILEEELSNEVRID